MIQNKSYSHLEKIITDSASKLGITQAKVNITPTKEGAAQAIISYKGNEEKILFTRDEVENASKGYFSTETKNKITKTISLMPPRIGPIFKPRN